MMEGIVPHSVLACIAENRQPRPDELAGLTDKIWHEAFAWPGASRDRGDARLIAQAALAGDMLMAA